MEPNPAPRPNVTTRARKIQPGLKQKAEQFLAKATVSKPSSTTTSPEAPRPRKRKLQDVVERGKSASSSLQKSSERSAKRLATPASTKKSKELESPKGSEEKRIRRYRTQAPQSYLQKLQRAQTQRMIVLKRTRSDTEAFPKEDVELAGSTGNIYTVTISQIPSCTCPDHRKGNECKHKVYVLHNVLKAPEHLQYQLAFLSSELKEIFASAPAIPTDFSSTDDTDGKRKPVEGECPICYMDFDEEHNALVWCKAACGNNMHKSCFDQWAASQRHAGVKCVYCRTPWQVDPGDLDEVKKAGSVGVDGYVNVGEQFGISQRRDYTTYHPFWVSRQLGTGW